MASATYDDGSFSIMLSGGVRSNGHFGNDVWLLPEDAEGLWLPACFVTLVSYPLLCFLHGVQI